MPRTLASKIVQPDEATDFFLHTQPLYEKWEDLFDGPSFSEGGRENGRDHFVDGADLQITFLRMGKLARTGDRIAFSGSAVRLATRRRTLRLACNPDSANVHNADGLPAVPFRTDK